MIVVMQSGSTQEQIEHVCERIRSLGLSVHLSAGQFRTIIGAIGEKRPEHLSILEDDVAKRDGVRRRFGDAGRPLLLAVRGGSTFSMPGMLSTIVFLGMNDATAEMLAREDPWHAYDSYRRFLASYSRAVWSVDIELYNLVEEAKRRHEGPGSGAESASV